MELTLHCMPANGSGLRTETIVYHFGVQFNSMLQQLIVSKLSFSSK